MAKPFHAQHKQVKGKRKILSDTSGRPEFRERKSIPHNLHGRIRDRGHYNIPEVLRNTYSSKGSTDEVSFHSIIGFFQVNFNYHPLSFSLNPHGIIYILCNDSVVNDVPTCNETHLFLYNNLRKDMLKTVSDYLHH